MNDKFKQMLKELIKKELEEMTGTMGGGVVGSTSGPVDSTSPRIQTPRWVSKHKRGRPDSAIKSMPGGKLVGEDADLGDTADGHAYGEKSPIVRRTLTESNGGKGDWKVIVYGEGDKEIDSWVIKNRTENEASKEAEADIHRMGDKVEDWSMTKMPLTEGRGRYYNLREYPMKSRSKVCYLIQEVNKMLKEIEYITDLNMRLKKESAVGPDMYWKRTNEHFKNINERMRRVSRKIECLKQ